MKKKGRDGGRANLSSVGERCELAESDDEIVEDVAHREVGADLRAFPEQK